MFINWLYCLVNYNLQKPFYLIRQRLVLALFNFSKFKILQKYFHK